MQSIAETASGALDALAEWVADEARAVARPRPHVAPRPARLHRRRVVVAMGETEALAAAEAAERLFVEWVVDEFRRDREAAAGEEGRGGEAA